jgi:hypothetical protein
MTSFRVRPKFKILSKKSIENIIEKLEKDLETTKNPVEGKVFKSHGLFRIKPEDQHYWSPQLNVSFEETSDGVLIRGMYGPHPTVWAIFLFGYAILGLALFFVALIGLVRLNLNLSSTILWGVPPILGLLILLYFLAQTGQKIGVEQTFTLHNFFEDALEEKIHIL